jgi:Flp pilus assembly protein TadG
MISWSPTTPDVRLRRGDEHDRDRLDPKERFLMPFINVLRRERPLGKKQRGQSLVEFAISSTVLLLLAMGLLDLSRAFYFAVNLQGAAREGARHAAWYNTNTRTNPYLYDTEVINAVKQSLYGAGFKDPQINLITSAGCLTPTDGNGINNKPYASSAYPSTAGNANVYICYTDPTGAKSASRGGAPNDNSWRLGDVNVSILMNFQLITPFIQGIFGNGLNVAYNEHFTIQGKP